MEQRPAGEEGHDRERDLDGEADQEDGLENDAGLELAVGGALDQLTPGEGDRRQQRKRRERQHRRAAPAAAFQRPAEQREQHDRPAGGDGGREQVEIAMAGLGEQRRALSRILLDEPVVDRVRGLGAQQGQRHQQQPGQGAPHVHDLTLSLQLPRPAACRARPTARTRGAGKNAVPKATATYSGAPEIRLRPASSRYVIGLTVATAWIQPESSVSGTYTGAKKRTRNTGICISGPACKDRKRGTQYPPPSTAHTCSPAARA